ncbi:Uncharacterized protein FVE85_2673 [Porphyridium purpureum]|uniref:NAD(P)-binding domain-containing protein n=1 Tax=Porphyridium purpureum TaxID=35688 RepID=A0A5J4YUC1_PORPP|nr:Uncharacterized protein FVE85_2673 [Porphyridium purpureum]|eukprot:POR7941..scf227_4
MQLLVNARGVQQAYARWCRAQTLCSSWRAPRENSLPGRQWLCTQTSSGEAQAQEQSGNESPERKTLVVVGGAGYVGSHIARYAKRCGLSVLCISRSGASSAQLKDASLDGVAWLRGDALEPESWKYALSGASGVVSCVGGFGSNEQMRRICGDTNVSVARAAHEAGVPRFVFVSARMYAFQPAFMRGYFEGKKMAEQVAGELFGKDATILRPAFVYGARQISIPKVNVSLNVPLQLIGKPLHAFNQTQAARAVSKLGGPFELAFSPPTSVDDLSKCAVLGATGYLQAQGQAFTTDAQPPHRAAPPLILESDDIAHCAKTHA